MAWIKATGFNDPDSVWRDEEDAYDDNLSLYTDTTSTATHTWTSFIEFTHAAFYCDKVKFYTNNAGSDKVDIDIYHDTAWHHVYEGLYDGSQWVEKDFTIKQYITKIRFRFYNGQTYPQTLCLREFSLYETTGEPVITIQAVSDINPTIVTANANVLWASGDGTYLARGFQYGLTQTNTWSEDEDVGGYEAGAFDIDLTNLTPNTEYWVKAYATNAIGTTYTNWVKFQTAASGDIPTGTKISICSDYSGYSYKLNESLTDDGNTYESYFTLSTDLAEKQGLHIKKRLLDLFSYFESKDSGTCKIYIKQDNEADWQYCGEVSMVGDEDIVVPHLPSENQDSSGDIDFLAKHFLIKFVFDCDFDFIGLITEFIPIGER